MDKYLIHYSKSTIELLEDTQIDNDEKEFVLGVLGNSSSSLWTPKSIQEHILDPIEEEKGKPSLLLLPSDGTSSILLETSAGKKKIPTKVYSADWKTLGRRARAIRDHQIIEEATHLLVFLGGRSDYYEKIAIRELKKGKCIYTIEPKSNELVEWTL